VTRKPAHRAPKSAARLRTRAIRAGVIGVALVISIVFLGTFVFPTASFLSQRRQIADAREELTVLDQQNKVLADQAAKLKQDDEIERLAREQYNLVKPGEEAYALLPVSGVTTTTTVPTATTTTVAPAKPADHRNPVRKAWDGFTGLF
jgi:cell division protein FtsB